MNTVFVLSWEYSDHSGYEVLRAYDSENKEIADADLAMLQEHGDSGKTYELTEVPLL